MNVADLIEEGIENLRKYGWIRGALGSKEEGFCAVGSFYSPDFYHLVSDAIEELNKDLGGEYTAIIDFNNHIAENVGDVIDQMMVTAKRLRNV